MKIGATEKLKFKNLQRRLDLPMWQAVGLLESIWKAAYRNAPAGNIGRLSNEEIAASIEWSGDADDLVRALVDTRWFDPDQTHRLLIHHWEQECESWLHANFKKHGKQFAKPTQSEPDDLLAVSAEATEQLTNGTTVATEQANSSLSPPYPSIPYPPPPSPWAEVEAVLFKHGVGEAVDAIRAVRDAGCTPTQVQNLIEHWRANIPAWGPGALYDRLLKFRPGQPFDSLWPEKSKQAQSEKAQKETIDQTLKLRSDRTAAAVQREADANELDRLESVGGENLNALSKVKLRELIREVWPDEKQSQFHIDLLPPKGPPKTGTNLRRRLLQHIERARQPSIA